MENAQPTCDILSIEQSDHFPGCTEFSRPNQSIISDKRHYIHTVIHTCKSVIHVHQFYSFLRAVTNN